MSKLRLFEESPRRIFAIGDLHGCPDELEVLLTYLQQEEGVSDEDLIIFIGDYIDRGPNSKAVVDRLLSFARGLENVVFLRGNHEDMLLDFLGFGGNMGHSYLYNGGVETFGSYGISSELPPEEIAHKLPRDHFSFYLNLDSYVLVDDFVFAHAGLNPLRDLKAQLDYDLFWIRDEFISNIHSFQKTVVFGHTPHQDVLFHVPFKIGIDTGLVFGNKLTCIELNYKHLLQVSRGQSEVEVKPFPEIVLKGLGVASSS